MKLRIASDLHLEQYRGMDMDQLHQMVLPPHRDDSDSVLVLAGDISSIHKQLVQFIGKVCTRFSHTLYVPGNHEWYKHDMVTYSQDLSKDLQSIENLSFVMQGVNRCDLDGVTFIMSTYWADGGETDFDRNNITDGLYDFRVIGYSGQEFTVQKMTELHSASKQEIKQILEQTPGKKVVITHHLPSYSLCHPRFGTALNGGFASESDDLLFGEHAPEYWIHGHTHDKIDTVIGNTKVLAYPRGYARELNNVLHHAYNGNYPALFVQI